MRSLNKAERKVEEWEEIDTMQCHFCGDVYAVEDYVPEELSNLFNTDNGNYYNACNLCLKNPAEPNYPDNIRPME